MSVNKTSIIISREYSERVKKKSFIITTILVPVLMLALSVLPTLIIVFAGSGETKTVAVIDDSGLILQNLTDNEEVRYSPPTKSTACWSSTATLSNARRE